MRPLLVCALLLSAAPAAGRAVLGNDSIGPEGGEIVFYPRMQDDEAFGVVLDVPDDHAHYQICRLLLWIGPNQFNVFTIRIHEANEDNTRGEIVWISDLDAFQVFGSRDQISSVDLRDYQILSDVRRLRVDFFHAPGFPAPPTIASDTDGLSGPRRNWIRFFQRNGQWWDGPVDDLDPEDRRYPQPPGDWLVRADIVPPDEFCPDDRDPLPDWPDAGPPPPPRDAAPPPPDAAVDEGPKPDRVFPDAAPPPDPDMAPPPDPDAAPPPDPDMAPPPDPDMAPPPDPDLGPPGFVRGFSLTRIHPTVGPPDRNQDVVILGSGFPLSDRPDVRLDDTRLLEVEVTATSTMLAIVPAGLPTGRYDLRVERADGQVAILPEAYTVGTDLAIESVDPASLPQGVTGTLSFLGNGFTSETGFVVGGALVRDVTIESGQRARGELETTLAAGVYDVEVHRGEEVAALSEGFTVLEGPSGHASGDDCTARPGGGSGFLALLMLLGISRRTGARRAGGTDRR